MASEPLRTEFFSTPASQSGVRLILSVDDESVVLYTRYRLLKNAGYSVLCASDGVQALQVFAEHPVDLVLLDYAMPGMDGGTVAQEIKQSKPDVPVILVSGREVPDEALMWVNCCMHKGEDPAMLLEKIHQLLPSDSTPMPNQEGTAA